MKNFIITIDTEGDNLWGWKYGDNITSENAKFLPRFQSLCEEFGFKPVYLTNYEMAIDPDFVSMAKSALAKGNCEIGMHLHAVNNPPVDYELGVDYPHNFPYLIEYPTEVMESKIAFQTKLLEDTFGRKIVTHRAGRWAMDKRYEKLLIKYGYRIDCSITPGINWNSTLGITESSHGSNYSKSPEYPFYVDETKQMLEVPVSIRTIHFSNNCTSGMHSFLSGIKHRVLGYKAWLRPNGHNLQEMLHLASVLKEDKTDYLMFMLHSSELMPGGSPTFKTEVEIESLYSDLRILFEYLSTFCKGRTLKEYLNMKMKSSEIIPVNEIL